MPTLPTTNYCGDTINFSLSAATGSTGTVILRHIESGHVISIAPEITGGTWNVNIAPIDTAEAPAGEYTVKAIVESGDSRTTMDVGLIKLYAPIDRPLKSTHIRKMIALLESHLEGRLDDVDGRGLESYTIGGVPITKISITDATNLLDRYKRALQTEIEIERAALGLHSGRIFYTTFQ